MKIEQRVTIKPNYLSVGWGTLDFQETNSGDVVNVELSDEQIIKLSQELEKRVKRINEQRYEQAKLVVEDGMPSERGR